MTSTRQNPAPAVRLEAGATTTSVVPISRGTGPSARVLGVVLVDRDGCRWQRTSDVDRLVTVATLTGGVVAAAGLVTAAARRTPARVGPITMGPGGWVSVKGAPAPRLRTRRPWWAVLLRARPLGR